MRITLTFLSLQDQRNHCYHAKERVFFYRKIFLECPGMIKKGEGGKKLKFLEREVKLALFLVCKPFFLSYFFKFTKGESEALSVPQVRFKFLDREAFSAKMLHEKQTKKQSVQK